MGYVVLRDSGSIVLISPSLVGGMTLTEAFRVAKLRARWIRLGEDPANG